jgi:hypothetical protein
MVKLKKKLHWDLRFSGMLGSVNWYKFTVVSEQTIGQIFKGQAAQE